MIREITFEDLAAIQQINAQALGYDLSLALTQKQFQACSREMGHLIFVYEADGGVVAAYIHAQVYESLYSERGLNILALAVLPPYQGRKLGRAMLSYLEEIAVRENLAFIRLNSAEHRTQAHRFYERNGYLSDKLQKRFIKHL